MRLVVLTLGYPKLFWAKCRCVWYMYYQPVETSECMKRRSQPFEPQNSLDLWAVQLIHFADVILLNQFDLLESFVRCYTSPYALACNEWITRRQPSSVPLTYSSRVIAFRKRKCIKKVWAHAIPNALMIFPHPFTNLCKAYYNRRYIVELVQSSWFINLCNKSIYRVFLVRGVAKLTNTPIARFMGPTWGPPGADRTQVGPMWATWTLLSGQLFRVNLGQYQMHSMVCCCSIILTTLTHFSLEKMAAILQTALSNAFSWMKIFYFDSNFTEVCS